VIFAAEEIPWEEMENGWKRKVLFSGQLTFVVLEAKGPTSGTVELHSHVHDQVSYIMEGDVEVHIGDETKQISTGGFFRVPSNAPHGVQVLSPKLIVIDAFTPPREDFR
jgi:quercetin dioxygenase-like cupin family protein